MNNFFVAISLVAFVPIVGAVFGDEPQSDFVKLQGTWRGTNPEGASLNLTVDGHEFKTYVRVKSSARGRGGAYTVIQEITIDETCSPKEIDFHMTDENGEEKIIPAIYKLKADKLTVCMDRSGKRRPSKFDGSTDGGTMIVYNRYPQNGKPAASGSEGKVTSNAIIR